MFQKLAILHTIKRMKKSLLNIKTKSPRRGLDEISSKILDLIFKSYPQEITLKNLAKKINIKDKQAIAVVNKIKISGIPIIISKNEENEKTLQASMIEPVSWIVKEKQSAEAMLELIRDLKVNGDEYVNNQKGIIYRMHFEYVEVLNEVFDKWHSLRFFDQLESDSDEITQ